MLVMYDLGIDKKSGVDKGFDYLAVARYDVGKIFKKSWDPDANSDQWAQLGKLIAERNPKKDWHQQSGAADGIDFDSQANVQYEITSILPHLFNKKMKSTLFVITGLLVIA